MNYLEELKQNKEIFFNFMKEKYPVHYNSNIFERDLQYAIQQYFIKKDIKVSYPEAGKLALDFAEYLVSIAELQRMTPNSWKVNFSTAVTHPAEEDTKNQLSVE